MSSTLELSVVLPTCMRAEVMRTTLARLINQTLDPGAYEIIVVDDGSTDHTEQVVREAADAASCRITFLKHPNMGPGYTQNRGIRQAAAPLILLMADDIFMAPGALAAHVAAHRRHADAHMVVLGNVTQSPELNKTAFQRKWDPFELRKLQQDQEIPYWLFWACNISLKRSFMLECGMFLDPRGSAGPAAHEDVEVGHRLSKRGMRLFHEKAALGYHFHPESLETATARSYQRGLNWEEAFAHMPNPELLVRQRIHTLGTLISYRHALTGERRAYLMGADRSMTRLAIDVVLRSLLFNSFTVPWFWAPVMRMAERHAWIEAAMLPRFYRGVVVYYFRKAIRDKQRAARMSGNPRAADATR